MWAIWESHDGRVLICYGRDKDGNQDESLGYEVCNGQFDVISTFDNYDDACEYAADLLREDNYDE